jgi:hypothetical protein
MKWYFRTLPRPESDGQPTESSQPAKRSIGFGIDWLDTI